MVRYERVKIDEQRQISTGPPASRPSSQATCVGNSFPEREHERSSEQHIMADGDDEYDELRYTTMSTWCCLVFMLAVLFSHLTVAEGTFSSWISDANPLLFIFLILHLALFLRFFTLRKDPGFLDQVDAPPLCAEDGSADGGVPLHYCTRCSMFQPRRTKHCKQCKKCVLTFDHHCFWIGGCVGERNTLPFIQMLVLWSATLTWYAPLIVSTFSFARDPLTYVVNNVAPLIMMLFWFGFELMVVGLLFYHIFLAFTAQTTWENIRRSSIDYLKSFPREVQPFSRGSALDNLNELCNRGSTGYIKWEYTWVEGDPIPFSWFENEYWSCC